MRQRRGIATGKTGTAGDSDGVGGGGGERERWRGVRVCGCAYMLCGRRKGMAGTTGIGESAGGARGGGVIIYFVSVRAV